ncbi:MAG TPA: acylphosphatase [Hanamia sp.]|jgi:acylphosphatase|nr:acylphosphatase [Hanamia sp.]
MKTVHLIITGKVQGVFFRASAKDTAEKYEVKGWIKNTVNGSVEALVTGEPYNIDEFVNWCKVGPEKAKVDHVAVVQKPKMKFHDFEVLS